MKHAHYDNNTGVILGFYAEDVHDTIPEPSIVLTEEQWQEALTTPKIVQDGNLIDAPPPPPAPELTIAEKLQRAGIDLADLRQALGLEVTP